MFKKFTLIELLAVIFIILLLMGLAARGIPMAMENSRMTKCASNLHDIGLAVTSFAHDNDHFAPFGPGVPNAQGGSVEGNIFNSTQLAEALRKYIKFIDATTKVEVGLTDSNGVFADVWFCPSALRLGEKQSSYMCRTDNIPLTNMDYWNPIVADRVGNHKSRGRMNILYANCTVRTIKETDIDSIKSTTDDQKLSWEE